VKTDRRKSARPTVVLHIGTMKSGTSYLQSVLKANDDRLAEAGVLFPSWAKQLTATREARSAKADRPTWDALLDSIHSWSGRAVVLSVEGLSFSAEDEVGRILAALRPCPVRVVITARDIARVIPSAWQTSLKNGFTWTLDEYVDDIMAPDRATSAAKHFWRRHDVAHLVEVWSRANGDEPVHLVTVPPSGAPPELLWQRFASVLEVDPDDYETDEIVNSNPSLTLVESEVMRRVNAAMPEQLGRERKIYIRKIFANELLRGTTSSTRPTLLPHARDWAQDYSQNLVKKLGDAPVVVTGTLDDLLPVLPASADGGPAEEPPHDIPTSELAAAAVHAAVLVMSEVATVTRGGAEAGALGERRKRNRKNKKEKGSQDRDERQQRRARRRARRARRAARAATD
jgi:hypothetical protein